MLPTARFHSLLALAVVLAWCLCTSADAALDRRLVYVSNWAQYGRGDCKRLPGQLPAGVATHVVFAFAAMTPGHGLRTVEPNDALLYNQTLSLKRKSPKLKVMIAVGGWNHDKLNATTVHLFSRAVATAASRKIFVANILAFTAKYGFDGIDFDWEYPAVPDRGGQPSDTPGFTALVAELRAASRAAGRPSFLITMAAGAGAYGYSGLDLAGLHPSVDYFNVMTYDYYGQWEKAVNFHTPWSDPQGDGDIRRTLDHFLRAAGVPPAKLNLGLALYGRSWGLASARQAGLGARALSGGVRGNCTGEPGFLSWREVKAMIAGGARVTLDPTAMAAYAVKGNQWVSFDLPQTLYSKIKAAQALNLGGTAVWAGDLDDAEYSMLRLIAARADPGPFVPSPSR